MGFAIACVTAGKRGDVTVGLWLRGFNYVTDNVTVNGTGTGISETCCAVLCWDKTGISEICCAQSLSENQTTFAENLKN